MSNRRSTFNLHVSGVEDHFLEMSQLKKAFDKATIRDPETALRMGKELMISSYIPGKLAFARFLRTTSGISMRRSQRFQLAEEILVQLDCDLDHTPETEAEIALELAELYHASRPVGALAALLRAHRLGASIPAERIERCRRVVLNDVDVNHLGDNPEDAYALAVELDQQANAPQYVELFYKLAFDGAEEKSILKGKAALGLAIFYGSEDEVASTKYYLAARNCGFPDLVYSD